MKQIITMIAVALFSSMLMGQQKTDSLSLNLVDLEEVIVQGSRVNAKLKDLPVKVEVIRVTPAIIGTSTDVSQLLKTNSGVDIIQYPGKLSAIGIRGFSPGTSNKYNALLINGLPAGTNNFSTLSLSNIQQVEIMKGPFSSLYGSGAMGGVINIVTPRSTGDIGGNASIGYGSYNLMQANASVGGTIIEGLNFDFNLYGEKQGNDYTTGNNNLLKISDYERDILSDDTYGVEYEHTKYGQFGADLRVGYDINTDWSVDVRLGTYNADDVYSSGSIFGVYTPVTKDIDRFTSSIEVLGKTGIHNIRIAPYYSVELNERYLNTADTAYISSNSTFKNYGFQLQDRIEFGKHNVIIGVDNKSEGYETQRWKTEETEKAPSKPNYSNIANGVLVQGHFKFLEDALLVTAGGRYDNIHFNLKETDFLENEAASETHNTFNPNIGVKGNLPFNTNVHASYGTGFLAPTAFQKAGNQATDDYHYIGNPDLKPESSATFDVGAGLNNRALGIEFDLTYFQTQHEDMIMRIDVPDSTDLKTYTNADEANMSGLELAASYDIGALYNYKFSLKAYANFTFMLNAKYKDDDGGEEKDLKYVRKTSGNFGLIFTDNKFSVRANGRYIGHRFEDNWFSYYNVRPELIDSETGSEPAVLEHPRHLVFDASVYYTINKMFSVGANVGNIFDENYTEKDGYNMPGRNFLLKGTVSF